MVRFLVLAGFGSFFLASQIFWFRRLGTIGSRLIQSKRRRTWLAAGGAALYIALLAYNFIGVRRSPSPTHLTLRAVLFEASFQWWVVGSVVGFTLLLPFGIAKRIIDVARSANRRLRPADTPDPARANLLSRRDFLSNTALGIGGLPFVACAYGFLFERLEYERSFVRVKLRRLPQSFDGFRIAQLSDIHISPFMGTREIRKVVDITNALNADLIVLTGDFVTWDPKAQGAVVEALSGLSAPYGIYGCLGNHELWTHTQASITQLFAVQGVKILRQERAQIVAGGASLNLIGVDFESHRGFRDHHGGYVNRYLGGVRRLLAPETANILLSHNPNTFDRAAELGIDLSLAGHTHGGQISLEFISPDLSPARLITPYVEGHFRKPGGQLYVNRGIGTIGVPIRFGAPPEITVFDLTREA
jgi:uncharacterized protein